MEKIRGIMRNGNREGVYVWFCIRSLIQDQFKTFKNSKHRKDYDYLPRSSEDIDTW